MIWKSWFFVIFLIYELQNGFRMFLRVKMCWILHLNRCWYAGGQFVTNSNWITETSVWPTFSLSTHWQLSVWPICHCQVVLVQLVITTYVAVESMQWQSHDIFLFATSESNYSTRPEMEYCASAVSMLAEKMWQIVEGLLKVLANL